MHLRIECMICTFTLAMANTEAYSLKFSEKMRTDREKEMNIEFIINALIVKDRELFTITRK